MWQIAFVIASDKRVLIENLGRTENENGRFENIISVQK